MIAGEQNIRKQLYSHWFDRAQTDVGVIWGIRNTHSCVTGVLINTSVDGGTFNTYNRATGVLVNTSGWTNKVVKI